MYGETQQGWQCPVCRTVYAPWVVQCFKDHSITYSITPSITLPTTTTPQQLYGSIPE